MSDSKQDSNLIVLVDEQVKKDSHKNRKASNKLPIPRAIVGNIPLNPFPPERELVKPLDYEFLIRDDVCKARDTPTQADDQKDKIIKGKIKKREIRKYVLPVDDFAIAEKEEEFNDNDSDKEKESKERKITKKTRWGQKAPTSTKTGQRKSKAPIIHYTGNRVDAWTQVHPAGYNEIPSLAAPTEDMIERKNPNPKLNNIGTQVTEMLINADRAALRHIELEEDNILWPTIGEFDKEEAVRVIEDYFDLYCEFDKGWEHYTNFVQETRDNYRSKFVYEVKWCRPTETLPVPKATVSAFFTIELPHYAALDDTVKVHYVLEGTRFPHVPGKIPFQQKWLYDILLDKLKIQDEITF